MQGKPRPGPTLTTKAVRATDLRRPSPIDVDPLVRERKPASKPVWSGVDLNRHAKSSALAEDCSGAWGGIDHACGFESTRAQEARIAMTTMQRLSALLDGFVAR